MPFPINYSNTVVTHPSFIRKFINSFVQMLTGSSIRTFANIFSGYFFALILGPSPYGIWQTVRVFLSYSAFTSLGIPFVMRRDFITLRAKGKYDEAENMAQIAMTYSFIVNPITAISIVIIAFLSNSETVFKISLIIVGLMYVTDLFSGIGNILHKGYNDYRTIAIGDIICGLGVLLIVPLVYYNGYYALLFGYLTLSLIQSGYYFLKRPMPYKWNWNFPILRSMIFTAFPIFLVTITSTVFESIDRLLIAGLLDFKNVGLYSLSSFIAQPITLMVSSFSIVLFTQLNERYGTSKEPHVIAKHVHLPQKFFSNLLPPLMGIGIVVLPVLTKVFLPKFQDGVLAAQINIFAIFFVLMAGFSANALFVLDKQKYTALSFFIAGSLKTAGSYITLKVGYGIAGVAICTLLAYLIYNILMLYFINKHLDANLKTFVTSLLSNLLSPLVIVVYCGFFLTYSHQIFEFMTITNPLIQTLLGLLMVGIVGAPFLCKAFSVTKNALQAS